MPSEFVNSQAIISCFFLHIVKDYAGRSTFRSCTFCPSDVMGVHSAEGKGFFPKRMDRIEGT
jgi:hypothetical protein